VKLAEQIVAAVRAHPGLTIYRLAILLDVDEGELHKVVLALASEGRLRSYRHRASLRWYEPGAMITEPPRGGIGPGTRAWEALVMAAPLTEGVTLAQLTADTRMSAAYAYVVMLRLEAAGLVRRRSTERRWIVSRNGHELLAEIDTHQS
jgi:DNA-binding IclR family transcriptional regulator